MSLFNAFLSDSDSEAPTAKRTTKPKKASTAVELAKSRNPNVRKPGKPEAVKTSATPKPKRQPKAEVERSSRPSRGNRGRGRGNARSGDRDNRGKRIFDRHSGSGHSRGVKKDGGGGHNWGKDYDPKAQYNTNVSIMNDEDAEKTPKETVEGEEPKENGEDVPEEEKEPEKVTLTLEQFKAQQAEKRQGLAFKEKEEVDVEEVKDGRAYAKKDRANLETEEAFMKFGTDKEKKSRKKAGRALAKQQVEDIGFRVKGPDSEETGGYRGRGRGRGRGSFRGRGGNGDRRGGYGGRGGSGNNTRGGHGKRDVIDVDTNDQMNFPSLGA